MSKSSKTETSKSEKKRKRSRSSSVSPKSKKKERSHSNSKSPNKEKKKKKKKKKDKSKDKLENKPKLSVLLEEDEEEVEANKLSTGSEEEEAEEEDDKLIEELRRKRAKFLARLPADDNDNVEKVPAKRQEEVPESDNGGRGQPGSTPIVYFEQQAATPAELEEDTAAEAVRVGIKYKVVVVTASILTDGRCQQLFQLAARVLPGKKEEEEDVNDSGESAEGEYFAICAPDVVSSAEAAENLSPGSKVREIFLITAR